MSGVGIIIDFKGTILVGDFSEGKLQNIGMKI